MLRRLTDHIVLHCSATPPDVDVGVTEIRQWHVSKGWSDIGYHYVIRRNGSRERGRPENQAGSHVKGFNANTLGICLVGGTDARQRPQNNFTPAQWESLKRLLTELQARYPQATILGHRDFPGVAKACPCFDAILWARKNGFRAAQPMRIITAAMTRAMKGQPEVEDGDEQDEGSGRTGIGKWLTAAFGGGGFGLMGGFGYGMDWLGIAVMMGGLVALVCLALVLMGYERRERLWDQVVGL